MFSETSVQTENNGNNGFLKNESLLYRTVANI